MAEQTKIAIVGWGNIGRGVFEAIKTNESLYGDVALEAIISRRPEQVEKETDSSYLCSRNGVETSKGFNILALQHIEGLENLESDVAILCGGSKDDLPVQGPFLARRFSTVDSFDTHKNIADYTDEKTQSPAVGYFNSVDANARVTGHLSAVSFGWDPGTFSLERVLMESFLPGAKAYAFYGLGKNGGLSMGHSDALRTIKGVKDARQYTHALLSTVEEIRKGKKLDLAQRDMHWRECFVVLENDIAEEKTRVKLEAIQMPNYFKPYKTVVTSVSQEGLAEIDRERGVFHDGLVIAVGENGEVLEYKNIWPSNPLGTAGILVATARAVHRLYSEGKRGAITSLDIPPAYYSPRSRDELLKNIM